jgi:hypothetical protein
MLLFFAPVSLFAGSSQTSMKKVRSFSDGTAHPPCMPSLHYACSSTFLFVKAALWAASFP